MPAGCAGSLDSQSSCCTAELSTDLTCCEVLDREMQCCPSGEIDAYGTCDGLASSIDLQGLPCKVPYSSLCMPHQCHALCVYNSLGNLHNVRHAPLSVMQVCSALPHACGCHTKPCACRKLGNDQPASSSSLLWYAQSAMQTTLPTLAGAAA